MEFKKKFKNSILSRKEQINVFAGDGSTKPPVNNIPGTGSDAPRINCLAYYYEQCIITYGSLMQNYCIETANLHCS